VPLLLGVWKTVIVEITVVPVGTAVSLVAAFSFAKLKLPFKTGFLMILMSGMMVPYAALMLPQFRAFDKLGLNNTLVPLILPGLFGNTVMMFFFIQYMKGIPNALIEAAKIDGAGHMKTFVTILLPLMGPAIAVQIIFWFSGIWNDFFAPSIYLTRYDSMTLQPMLAKLNGDNSAGVNLPLIMTGAVLSSIPILILYVSFQRFFVESVAISGVKG
jgi:multiple sugar transport system permease protein